MDLWRERPTHQPLRRFLRLKMINDMIAFACVYFYLPVMVWQGVDLE